MVLLPRIWFYQAFSLVIINKTCYASLSGYQGSSCPLQHLTLIGKLCCCFSFLLLFTPELCHIQCEHHIRKPALSISIPRKYSQSWAYVDTNLSTSVVLCWISLQCQLTEIDYLSQKKKNWNCWYVALLGLILEFSSYNVTFIAHKLSMLTMMATCNASVSVLLCGKC